MADSGYIRLSDDKKYLLVTLYKGERYETRRDYQWYNESQFTQQTFDSRMRSFPLEGFDLSAAAATASATGRRHSPSRGSKRISISLNIVVAREMARSYEPLLRNNLLQYDPVVMGMMDSVKDGLLLPQAGARVRKTGLHDAGTAQGYTQQCADEGEELKKRDKLRRGLL